MAFCCSRASPSERLSPQSRPGADRPRPSDRRATSECERLHQWAAPHTSGKTERAAGCPAGTEDTACRPPDMGAKGRDGGPRRDCCQPGGQPQRVSSVLISAIRSDSASQEFKSPTTARDAAILIRHHPLVPESDPDPLRRSHPPLLAPVRPDHSAVVSWLVGGFLESIRAVLLTAFNLGHWVAKLRGSSRRALTLARPATALARCLCEGSLHTTKVHKILPNLPRRVKGSV